jgi:hypothetical protein
MQDMKETAESIMKLGNAIGCSDLSSAFINERRITSMRALLDNFEKRNEYFAGSTKEIRQEDAL